MKKILPILSTLVVSLAFLLLSSKSTYAAVDCTVDTQCSDYCCGWHVSWCADWGMAKGQCFIDSRDANGNITASHCGHYSCDDPANRICSPSNYAGCGGNPQPTSTSAPTPTPTLIPDPAPNIYGYVQGYKRGLSPSSSQTVTVPGVGSYTSNPYTSAVWNLTTTADKTVSTSVPSGYAVGYTLCYNDITCHETAPTPGASVLLNDNRMMSENRDSGDPYNRYADLYWHFDKPNACGVLPDSGSHFESSTGFAFWKPNGNSTGSVRRKSGPAGPGDVRDGLSWGSFDNLSATQKSDYGLFHMPIRSSYPTATQRIKFTGYYKVSNTAGLNRLETCVSHFRNHPDQWIADDCQQLNVTGSWTAFTLYSNSRAAQNANNFVPSFKVFGNNAKVDVQWDALCATFETIPSPTPVPVFQCDSASATPSTVYTGEAVTLRASGTTSYLGDRIDKMRFTLTGANTLTREVDAVACAGTLCRRGQYDATLTYTPANVGNVSVSVAVHSVLRGWSDAARPTICRDNFCGATPLPQ